jgi:hypothetical protein
MKLLIHDGNVLASSPIDDGDNITANGVTFPKSSMAEWEIIDVNAPDDFEVGKYKYTANGFEQIQIDKTVPSEIDAVAAILIIDQYGLGEAYRTWLTALSWDKREIVARRGKWRRDNALVIDGAAAIGITTNQLDEMFIAASKIQL